MDDLGFQIFEKLWMDPALKIRPTFENLILTKIVVFERL